MGQSVIQLLRCKQMKCSFPLLYAWRCSTLLTLTQQQSTYLIRKLLMCLSDTTVFKVNENTLVLSKASCFLVIHLTHIQGTLCQKWPNLPQLIFTFTVLAPRHLLISLALQNYSRERIKALLCLHDPHDKGKTERERKQCFILQHLVQSAPWGWTLMGGLTPVVKESGGCEPALFFYSIKNACGWSALWITRRATSKPI